MKEDPESLQSPISSTTLPTPRPLDDPDLPARIRRRDRDALAAVVDAYLDQILRAARGAGLNRQQAEDMAQATFATFIETAPRFEGRSQVRTWLFGILYRKLQEARRGFAKDRRADDIDSIFESRFDDDRSWSRPPRGPEDRLFAQEARREIGDCLEAVPDRQRLAFILREVEELSTKEICKILGASSTNLGVMLFRARNRRLAQAFFAHPPSPPLSPLPPLLSADEGYRRRRPSGPWRRPAGSARSRADAKLDPGPDIPQR